MSCNKVDTNGKSMLVIGLGGVGMDMMKAVKAAFRESFNPCADGTLPYIAFMGFDTDGMAQGELPDEEFLWLHDPVLHHLPWQLPDDAFAWADPCTEMLVGTMGGSRNATNLLLRCRLDEVLRSLERKLHQVDGMDRPVCVVILGSLCGWTGSGLILSVAQLLRHVWQQMSQHPSHLDITGYFATQELFHRLMPYIPQEQRDTLDANAYAALKELHFWQSEGDKPVCRMNDVVWQARPLDRYYLLNDAFTMDEADVRSFRMLTDALKYQCSCDAPFGAEAIQVHRPENYCAMGNATFGLREKEVQDCCIRAVLERLIPREGDDPWRPTSELPHQLNGRLDPACVLRELEERLLPPFLQHREPADVAALQQMEPSPHVQARLSDEMWQLVWHRSEEYQHKAWEIIQELLKDVACAPDKGPFALKNCVMDSEFGIEGTLQKLKDRCERACANAAHEQGYMREECSRLYPTFEHPPFLARRRAIDAYMDALSHLWRATIREAVLHRIAAVLDQLLSRLERICNNTVHQALNALQQWKNELDARPADPILRSLIDRQSGLRDGLVQAFSCDLYVLLMERNGSGIGLDMLQDMARGSVQRLWTPALNDYISAAMCVWNCSEPDAIERIVKETDNEARRRVFSGMRIQEHNTLQASLGVPSACRVLNAYAPLSQFSFGAMIFYEDETNLQDAFIVQMEQADLPLSNLASLERMKEAYCHCCTYDWSGLHLLCSQPRSGDITTDWYALPDLI